MTKTKLLLIQLLLSAWAVAITTYFFIFTPYYITNDPSFALGLVYSSSSVLIIIFNILAWMILPILFVLSFFRRKQSTPKLDKAIKYFLYTGVAVMLFALMYNFTYSFTQVPELVSSALKEDKYFFLKIALSLLVYIVPGALFYITSKLTEFTGPDKPAL